MDELFEIHFSSFVQEYINAHRNEMMSHLYYASTDYKNLRYPDDNGELFSDYIKNAGFLDFHVIKTASSAMIQLMAIPILDSPLLDGGRVLQLHYSLITDLYMNHHRFLKYALKDGRTDIGFYVAGVLSKESFKFFRCSNLNVSDDFLQSIITMHETSPDFFREGITIKFDNPEKRID